MSKKAEQVVAEALGIHADHPDMWDLEARDVVNALREAGMLRDSRPVIDREAVAREVYRELYPGLIDRPDSERTPESDLADADRAYQTWDSGNEGFAPGIICRRVAERVIAHLDADTVDDFTEWEYGYTSKWGRKITTSREAAEIQARLIREEIEQGHSSGDLKYHGKVVRRRVVHREGEWEEIPNE